MNQHSWMSQYSITWFAVISIVLMLSGCVTPAMLKPVAEQNSENIDNYNANVAIVVATLKREASFHGNLEIQIARNKLAKELVTLPKQWMGSPNPSPHDLTDSTKDPRRFLQGQVDTAKEYRSEILNALQNEQAEQVAMVAKYPLVADIVMENPGFSVTRVIDDAFALIEINGKIINEHDNEVRFALMSKRNRLLDPYMAVQLKNELVQVYLDALEDYAGVIIEQSQIATNHANSILAYTQSTPRISSLAGALKDDELQTGVLDIIRKKKGDDYADRVNQYIGQANSFFGTIEGLSGK